MDLLFRRWLEPRILAPLAISVAALWGFLELTDEVFEGEAHTLDTRILLALRAPGSPGDPLGPGWFEELVRDITALGSTGVLSLIVLATVLFLLLDGRARMAGFVLLATGGGALVSSLLKELFGRPRPDLLPHGMQVYTASFPSGHAMLSAVVYLTLAALLARVVPTRRLKIFLLSVAMAVVALVGMSRVYLAVHWPSDVLAGWAAGAAWALACWGGAQVLTVERREPPGR
jgi:undecaprenyl-diphosphatase